MAETQSTMPQAAEMPKQSDVSSDPWPDASKPLQFKVQYGRTAADLKRPAESTVNELKTEVEKIFGVPSNRQKLMFKGMGLKNDDYSLEKVGVKTGAKILLIGSKAEDAAVAAAPKDTGTDLKWDEPTAKEEPISKQTQHAKVLAKGRPEDGLPGIKDRQVPLQEHQNMIPGLLNSQGSKVRLTFRPELQQLWVGSATSTQKVPYGSISKIESYPIEGEEEYSILALHLGSGGTSKYWLYYVPSQYVAAIKVRIIGVMALI
eukprot:jgi/Chrzof1/1947/Cz10g27140.t1